MTLTHYSTVRSNGRGSYSYRFDAQPGPIASNLEQIANYCVLRPIQPHILSGNEYQPMGGDALRIGNNGSYGSWQVKLCDPLYETCQTCMIALDVC